MKSTAVIIVMGKRIRSLLWLQIHALVKCCFVRLRSRGCGGQVERGSSIRANCRVLCFKVGLPRVLIVCVVRSRARIAD